MSGERTEEPTPRRLREARRRGEWPRSREWTGSVALLAGLAALAVTGPGAVRVLSAQLRAALAAAPGAEPAPLATVVASLAVAARLLLPLLLAPALAAGAAAAFQSGGPPMLSGLAVRWERLDPAAGLRRMVSAGAWSTVALRSAQGALLLALGWTWLRGHAGDLARLPGLDPRALWRAVPISGLAWMLAAAGLAFGLLDLVLAHRRHRRALRMTREEVRREAREDAGDPRHREERRRHHRALLEAGAVSRATVVVVNPTRIAVALHHRAGSDEAPRVLAKGIGAGAARIRAEARRARVPIVRDVLLARALHRLADPGEEIPTDLYEAAAAVLVHVRGIDPGARP